MCTTCNCYAKLSKIAVDREYGLKKKCPTFVCISHNKSKLHVWKILMSITCNHGQTPIHQTAQKLSKISFFVRQS